MKKNLLFLFIGLNMAVYSQSTLSGKITDSKNQPLNGVDVYITEIHKGTTTNKDGFYQLKNIPNSKFTVTAAFLGYESQQKLVNFSQSKQKLDFSLKETVFKMDEVIIATPFNKLQSQNVMKVERASIAQLKNAGAATLVQGISSLPGVSQVSTGVAIGKPVIRGLRGNRVLVYSQGLRLENQQFGAEHGLGVDESSIESVEVIKGPASLLYGSDAMGGVLFFNPLNFADDNSSKLNFNQKYFSNTLGSSTSIGFRKSYTNWKFLVNGNHRFQSDYKIPDGKRVTDSRFEETTLNTGINFNNHLISSTLRFNFDHQLVGIPEEIGEQSTHKSAIYPYQDLTNKMLSLKSIVFLNNSKITSTFGYTNNDRIELEAPSNIPALHLKLKTSSYDVKWHLPKIKKFESILGVQGMHQTNATVGEEVLIPNATTDDFGVFYTANYDFGTTSLQAGIRFDQRKLKSEMMIDSENHVFNAVDKHFSNFTTSLGVKTQIFNKITGRFNFASGFRAPNLAELTSNGVHEGSNRYEIGSNNLTSERNYQADVALEYNSTHFEIFANGFYNYINNYIYISPNGQMIDQNFVYNYVQNDAKLYGGEFGIHIHPHPLDWLHIQSSYEMVTGKQKNGNYLPLIPANKLTNTLRVEFKPNDKLNKIFAAITLTTHFKQNKVSEFETPTNSYNLVNSGFGGTIKFNKSTVDVSINANNLFNQTYIDHLSRLKVDNIPNIGRNIIVSLKYNFL